MADRTVTYNFKGNFANLAAGLGAMGKGVNDLGVKMTALDKNGAKMRAGLTAFGSTAGKVGLVAAAGLGVVVAAAARFDKAMSSVQAATHETASNMDLLRAAAIKAGADTAYSASEAASAIEELAKAGVSTSDILGGGLSGSLNLAAAGAVDVADAAELAATAMTQFKLGGDQVNHVADLLAAGAGKAQGSVGDLGMALKQSGLVAAQTGLSIEETVGTLSAFASAGLIGSDAGTSFKTMLQSLTPTSTAAKEEMERLGISAYDAQGNFVGMTAFAGQLREALAPLSTEAQNAALKVIFGSDAVRAASVIYQQGADGIQGWTDKVDDAGYAAETAATRMDNLAGDWEQFTGSLETALIGAGDGAQGPLRSLVQGATDVVNAFNKLPQSGQNAATGLLAVTAVLGGGLWFTAKTITGISNAKNALSDLGIEAGRTRGALANIGTAAVGIAAVVATLDVLQAGFDKLANTKLDTANLSRDLEALADGRITENLDNLFHTFRDIDNGWQAKANPLSWISSWDPSGFEAAEKNITAIDAALAGLVESGNADMAAEAFANLGPTAEKAGLSVEELKDLFPEYATALDNAGSAAEGAAGSNDELAGATGKAATAADRAAARMQRMAAALEKQQKAARDTAKSFITLGDSLDNPKKSLGEWLGELQKQAAALRDFTKNAQTAAKRGLDDGLIKSLNEAGPAGALRMKQLANATDAEIKRANKAWRQGQAAIREYVDMQVPDKKIDIDTSAAMKALTSLRATYDSFRDKTVHITVTASTNANLGDIAANSADGGSVPKDGGPYADRFLYMLAPGEEVITNRHGEADRFRADRAAGRIPGYADGGTVGGARKSLEDQLAIAEIMQQIRDLRRSLAKDGKEKLDGLDRRIAELQLRAAEKELRLAEHREEREARAEAREKMREERQDLREKRAALRDIRDSFSLDSLLPAQELTFAQQVRGEIDDFKQQILDAGGVWTKEMRRWARDMMATAREYDATQDAIKAETERREALVETLNEQQSQLDDLNRTMEAFGASVANNFLSDPFGGTRTAGPPSAELAAAQAQLAALQGSSGGEAAAQASRLMQQIAIMQQSQPLSGLASLRETLTTDTQNANAFAEALRTLAAKGLDTSGPLGGLYQQLAQSGDFATANDLAALSADQIDEYEKLFKAREDAAATVAAQTTQAVYGEQQAALQALVAATNAAIATQDATLTVLNAQLAILGEQVRVGAEQGSALLQPQLAQIDQDIKALPRQLQQAIRQAGK